MNDQARWHEQGNQGERVIANQGGPQYISNDGPQYSSNGGAQYSSNGGAQYNNQSGQQCNNTGGGSMMLNVFQQMRDLFEDGLTALKHREYPKVVARFSDFLSTAESARTAPGGDSDEMSARAHVYLVLGLLSGS